MNDYFNAEILDLASKQLIKHGLDTQTMKLVQVIGQCLVSLANASRRNITTAELEQAHGELVEITAECYIAWHTLVSILGEDYCRQAVAQKLWNVQKTLRA